MQRAFIALVLLAANVRAQKAKPSLEQQLANVTQLVERGRTGEAERSLRQLIPKPKEEVLQDSGIFTPAGIHDLLWAMVGRSYLGANDYRDAERVTEERLRAVRNRR